MRQEWEPEDLIEVWTLLEDDMAKLRNMSGGRTRLGFALLGRGVTLFMRAESTSTGVLVRAGIRQG